MCFVDHDGCAVFLGQTHDFGHVGHVAFHGEHAVGDNEFELVGVAALELFLQTVHVVVAVFELAGERQAAPFDYGGMVLLVPDNVVFAASEGGNHTEIDFKAGGVYHHVFLADVVGDCCFEFLVQVECAVEERRAGAAGAVFAGGLDGRFFYAGVVDKSCVAVGAEHEHAATVDNHFGILLRGNCSKIWIHAGGFGFLGCGVLCEFSL